MKRICITITMLSIMIVAFALPCVADPNQEIIVTLTYYGPPEDINHDGYVDYLDVSLLVSSFGDSVPPVWFRVDINRDYQVDYLDASRLVTKYGLMWIVP
jgi:hypothetical protein